MPSRAEPAQPPAGAPAASVDLQVKLVWLTVFRTVATTLLLGAIAFRMASGPLPEEGLATEQSLSFVVIGGVYLLTVIYGLVLRRGRAGLPAAYLQIAGDVATATAVVYLTGGVDSPFTFTFSVAVIAAAILLGQRGAVLASAAGSAAYTVMALAIQAGVLRLPSGNEPVSFGRLVFQLVSVALAQAFVALLASYLSRQLSATGGRLSRSEAQVRELAQLQRQILACMPSGLITCTRRGEVTYVNRAAEAILGRASDRWPSHVDELIPGALAISTQIRRNELAVQTPLGRRILGLTVTPMEGGGGDALLIVFQDLTELRRIEDELRRADRLAALGSLAAQLAHEIRNPLASMRGSAQMLSEDLSDGAQVRRLTNILVRESDRLAGLVEAFLQFARPPKPALQELRLDQLAMETVEMVKADPLARDVQISVAASPLAARADAGQLRQVLLNLLRNAMEAVGPGGQVRVKVDQGPQGPRLQIWDSAGSIPAADLDRIFEPFFTTRSRGTGLGLSTAHSIVIAHGGKISARSAPATGTELTVELPGAEEARVASPGGR